MELTLFYILSIVFIATLVRSTFGFGESLIAVPLLILFIPIEIAVPFSVLISIFIAAIVVVQDRKEIHFQSAKWLIIFAILGIPIGLLLLIHGNENFTKATLGILLIAYSTYSLISKNSFILKKDTWLGLFISGFLSGVLGGAYGLNGPPLVIYGDFRKWKAKNFRATLQAYFLPVSLIGMLGYWYKGLWHNTVSYYFLISIPVIIPAIFLGRYFNTKLKEGTFLKYIYIGLMGIGIILFTLALV